MVSSKRLESVFRMADPARSIGDIGCDHGYISFALLEENVAERVVATDISAPSLEKARGLLSTHFEAARYRLRLGDGFFPIEKGEIDAAIVIGMGGRLIADILREAGDKIDTLDYLIVQPMQGAEDLFEYITNNRLTLLDSDLIEERGKYYPVMKIRRGDGGRLDWGHFVRYESFKPMAERELKRLRGVVSAVEKTGREELIASARKEVRRWEEYLENYGNRR